MAVELDPYQIAGLLGGGAAWLYQVRTRSRREKIRTDLEILDKARALLGHDNSRVAPIEAALVHRIDVVYGDPTEAGRRKIPWPDLALFVFCAIGAFGFAPDDYGTVSWQLVVAGALAFVGFGALLNASDAWRGIARG